jgi:Uma2 family endonuclease
MAEESTGITNNETEPRLTIEIAQLFPRQREWNEADYFALPDTNRFIELSEGELIVPPHPTDTHQRVTDALYAPMRSFVHEHNLGVIRFAPLPVRLWPGKIREPDILFVSHAHADRISEQYYGPPDLVVEIISPGTRRIDQGDKFVEYARAGVSEYWLVDPEQRTIEIFVLKEDAYVLLDKFGAGEKARSQMLPGFQVSVDMVFAI